MASNPITNARRDTLRAEAAALTAEAAERDALLNPAGPPPPPKTPPSTAGRPGITRLTNTYALSRFNALTPNVSIHTEPNSKEQIFVNYINVPVIRFKLAPDAAVAD